MSSLDTISPLDPTSDEFLKALQQQDEKAFTRLYDAYADALYGVIYRIVQDQARAEDALQETFVRIWNKIHSYDRSKGRLFTWMLTMARRIAIDVVRSKEAKQQARTESTSDHSFDSKGPRSHLEVDHIGLREVLSGLPGEQVEVIQLIYFRGHTHKEVADVLELPLGTVKGRVRLAMNHLRKALGNNSMSSDHG